MDQRDPRGLSGLESSHAHLGIPIFGPGTQSEVPAINPMTNQNMLFQSAHLGTLSEVHGIHPLTNQNMSFQNEDIEEKIRSFAQQGPRVVSILSANGSVSSVTLRQAGESGDTIRYEGLHEIMSLSGLYLPNDGSGSQNQREGLTISLATAGGHVVGRRVGEQALFR